MKARKRRARAWDMVDPGTGVRKRLVVRIPKLPFCPRCSQVFSHQHHPRDHHCSLFQISNSNQEVKCLGIKQARSCRNKGSDPGHRDQHIHPSSDTYAPGAAIKAIQHSKDVLKPEPPTVDDSIENGVISAVSELLVNPLMCSGESNGFRDEQALTHNESKSSDPALDASADSANCGSETVNLGSKCRDVVNVSGRINHQLEFGNSKNMATFSDQESLARQTQRNIDFQIIEFKVEDDCLGETPEINCDDFPDVNGSSIVSGRSIPCSFNVLADTVQDGFSGHNTESVAAPSQSKQQSVQTPVVQGEQHVYDTQRVSSHSSGGHDVAKRYSQHDCSQVFQSRTLANSKHVPHRALQSGYSDGQVVKQAFQESGQTFHSFLLMLANSQENDKVDSIPRNTYSNDLLTKGVSLDKPISQGEDIKTREIDKETCIPVDHAQSNNRELMVPKQPGCQQNIADSDSLQNSPSKSLLTNRVSPDISQIEKKGNIVDLQTTNVLVEENNRKSKSQEFDETKKVEESAGCVRETKKTGKSQQRPPAKDLSAVGVTSEKEMQGHNQKTRNVERGRPAKRFMTKDSDRVSKEGTSVLHGQEADEDTDSTSMDEIEMSNAFSHPVNFRNSKEQSELSKLFEDYLVLRKQKEARNCPVCNRVFKKHSSVWKHMETHFPNKKRPYQCAKCKRVFRTGGDLETHILAAHKEVKAFSCPYCQKNFASLKNKRNHFVENDKCGAVSCLFCRKVITRKCERWTHLCLTSRSKQSRHSQFPEVGEVAKDTEPATIQIIASEEEYYLESVPQNLALFNKEANRKTMQQPCNQRLENLGNLARSLTARCQKADKRNREKQPPPQWQTLSEQTNESGKELGVDTDTVYSVNSECAEKHLKTAQSLLNGQAVIHQADAPKESIHKQTANDISLITPNSRDCHQQCEPDQSLLNRQTEFQETEAMKEIEEVTDYDHLANSNEVVKQSQNNFHLLQQNVQVECQRMTTSVKEKEEQVVDIHFVEQSEHEQSSSLKDLAHYPQPDKSGKGKDDLTRCAGHNIGSVSSVNIEEQSKHAEPCRNRQSGLQGTEGRIKKAANDCFVNSSNEERQAKFAQVGMPDTSVQGGKKTYSCTICKKVFARYYTARHHMKIHMPNRIRPHKCSTCEKAFYLRSHLMQHIREVHPDGKPFSCPRCQKRFKVLRRRDRHYKICSKVSFNIANDKPKVLRESNSVERPEASVHVLNYMNNEKLSSPSESLLSGQGEHQQTDKAGKNTNKPVANLTVANPMEREKLSNHTELLIGTQLEIQDTECRLQNPQANNQKASSRKREEPTKMAQVVRTDKVSHGKKKTHNCTVCHKAFATLSGVRVHMRIHSSNRPRPHICSTCQKAFYCESHLKQHIREVHVEGRPFLCQLCLKSFKYSKQRDRHFDTCHKNGPLQCSLCKKAIAHGYQLERHKCESIPSDQSLHAKILQSDKLICQKEQLGASFVSKEYVSIQENMPQVDSLIDGRATEVKSGVSHDHPELAKPKKSEKTVYGCVICGEAFDTLESLKKHKELHSSSSSRGKSNVPDIASKVEDHQTVINENGNFVCHMCQGEFREYNDLRDHLTASAKLKKCVCYLCEETCTHMCQLQNHMKKHMEQEQFFKNEPHQPLVSTSEKGRKHANTEVFKCDFCDMAFSKHRYLTKHLKRRECANGPSKCKRCGRDIYYSCQKHCEKHQDDCKEKPCAFGASEMIALENDLNKEKEKEKGLKNSSKKHWSDDFVATFKNAAHVNRPVLMSVEPPFRCTRCNQTFARRNYLTKHLRRRKYSDGPSACTGCGIDIYYSCENNRCDLHKSVYEERPLAPETGLVDGKKRAVEKSNSCSQVCTSEVAQPGSNNEETNLSTSEQSFACHICNKNFSKHKYVTNHLRRNKFIGGPMKCKLCHKDIYYSCEMHNHACKEIPRTGEKEKHAPERFSLQTDSSENEPNAKKQSTEINKSVQQHGSDSCFTSFQSTTEIEEPVKAAKEPIQCSKCGTTFVSRADFRMHLMKRRYTNGPVKCERCGIDIYFSCENKRCEMHNDEYKERAIKAETDRVVMMSAASIGKEEADQEIEKLFMCAICNKSFATRYDLVDHLQNHERNLSCRKCNKCGKVIWYSCEEHVCWKGPTVSEVGMQQEHEQGKDVSSMTASKETEKLFKCSACGKIHQKWRGLRNHIKVNRLPRGYLECKECGDVIHYKCQMLIHSCRKGDSAHSTTCPKPTEESMSASSASFNELAQRRDINNGWQDMPSSLQGQRYRKECVLVSVESVTKHSTAEEDVKTGRGDHSEAFPPCEGSANDQVKEKNAHSAEADETHFGTSQKSTEECFPAGPLISSDKSTEKNQKNVSSDSPYSEASQKPTDKCLPVIANPSREQSKKVGFESRPTGNDTYNSPLSENPSELKRRGRRPGKKIHKCSVCGKVFRKPYLVRKHMQYHTGERKFPCMLCGKGFAGKHELKNHGKVHLNEKPFKCDQCGQAFNYKASLKKHKESHERKKSCKCGVCGRSFQFKKQLLEHLSKHDGKERKVYKRDLLCHICGKLIKTPFNMHLQMHVGEKPFQCSICPKSFPTKVQLNGHFLTHTGTTKYKCNICDMMFRYKIELMDHVIMHWK